MIRGRLGQLGRAHLGDLGLLLLRREPVERLARLAQRRVLQVALLAAGAAHEHRVHALGVVLGHRRGALRRLVVGVGVDGEQRQRASSLEQSPRSTLSAPCHDGPGHLALRRRARPAPASWPPPPLALVAVGRRRATPATARTLRPPTRRAAGAPTTTTTTTTTLDACRSTPSAGGHRCRPRARRRPASAPRPVQPARCPGRTGGADRRPLHVRRRGPLAAADLDRAARRHRRAGPARHRRRRRRLRPLGRGRRSRRPPARTARARTITGAVEGGNELRHRRLGRPVPAGRRRRTPTASRCTPSTSRPSCPTASPAPTCRRSPARRRSPSPSHRHLHPRRLTADVRIRAPCSRPGRKRGPASVSTR